MKTNFFVFYLIAFFGVHLAAKGEAANEFFVTEDRYVRIMFLDGVASPYVDLMTADIRIRESLPVQDFPEGNWGGPEHGLQLSLRFNKTNYTNGEAIVAVLLLRNTSATNLNLFEYCPYTEFCDGPANFNVVGPLGVVPPSHPPLIPAVMPTLRDAPASKTQHKILEHVNSGYQLTNGTYTVQAVLKVIYPGQGNRYGHCEIKSAKVPIVVR